MIKESEVFKIGKLVKPHGIKGEISFAFENDVFDRVDCPYLICRIDNILVPFFIKEYRFKGSETALITFEDIDSDRKALRMAGLDVYFPRKYYEEDSDENIEYSWNFFIGFSVTDKLAGELGIIEAIDDKTLNTLFLIKNEDEELIIPATEDFIEKVDPKKKVLYLNLPEGLI
ncbi:16S rRNA processing protein RimM [Dysgonomonas sp. PFB1-18]|uniref:ribosome maturation factor RimM n=1 Tax=unclassified Dysgonomonas TaxID=2630389 RepID=UPI0024759CA5|nr:MULTISPECIES: ribosome maturation factor RimM [unclassified Dysgonomonas]MDH6307583.1 16S rRNA processing protein RimM [Dysgonomonas sp. PF1-14]MDH6337501.1 16S rRNA processing protein RimM [Dysgonomonas sp. PF1-16]MDH6378726.1 16S rRNA processing protein RimM [Dysgonomonas sp. PFB1-18]MDH6399144.1 16S rRNA processing protein RimM [Dysgonomonas sp. PF1-23]